MDKEKIPIKERTFETHDEYQRKPVADKVIQLLTSDINVSPMVIDGGWGVGKTEFCRKLIKLFKQKNAEYHAIYLDAFKADYANEPLMTLIAAIAEELPKTKRDKLIKKAIPAARFALKTSLKAGVGWVLRQNAEDVVDSFEKDVRKAGEDAVNVAVESLLQDHVNANKNIEALRQSLVKLAEDKKIVIFVDELDRCRPDFAVTMLESIKHIFDVRGVQFVLITNTEQLRASINHCYGEAVAAHSYLDKFIGFSFDLPFGYSTNGYDYVDAATKHFHRLAVESNLLGANAIESESMRFAYELIETNHLSLRQVETWVKYLEVYQVVTNGKGLGQNSIVGYRLLRVFGVFIFCFAPEIRGQMLRGVYNAEALIAKLGKTNIKDQMNNNSLTGYSDRFAIMIAIESNVKTQRFTIDDVKELEQWRVRVAQFFSGGVPRLHDESCLDEVTNVLRMLSFGNQ